MKTEYRDITQNVYSTTPLLADSSDLSPAEKATQIEKLNQELLAVRAVLKKDFTLGRQELEAWFFRVVYISYGMFLTENLLTRLGYDDDKLRDAYFAQKHRASGPFLKDHAYRRIALYFGVHNSGYPRTTGAWKKTVRATIHEAIKFYQIESLREFIGFDFAMVPELGLSNAVAANGETSPRGKLVQTVPAVVKGSESSDLEPEPIEVQVVDVTETSFEVPQASPSKAEKKQNAKEAILAARMKEIVQDLKLLPGLRSLLVETQGLAPVADWPIQAEAKVAIVTLKEIAKLLEEIR